jgi:hypothetical protein
MGCPFPWGSKRRSVSLPGVIFAIGKPTDFISADGYIRCRLSISQDLCLSFTCSSWRENVII